MKSFMHDVPHITSLACKYHLYVIPYYPFVDAYDFYFILYIILIDGLALHQ